MTSDSLRARVSTHFETMYRPGSQHFHQIVTASESAADGTVAFSGAVYDADGGFPVGRIALIDAQGTFSLLHGDQANDSDPKWSPDGTALAYLSDRGRGGGNYRLFVASGAALHDRRVLAAIDGEVVESYSWSPDGSRILVQTADAGADAAGAAAHGRVGSEARAEQPDWMPQVSRAHTHAWRHAYVVDRTNGTRTTIGSSGQNVWEAAWCGPDEIVAIISANPTEGGWYQTEIGIAPATGGAFVRFAQTDLEVGGICAAPDGKRIAVVEGRFHRNLTLGHPVVLDRHGGTRHQPAVEAETSRLEWRDADTLFFSGFRAPGEIVGELTISTDTVRLLWETDGVAGRKVPSACLAARGGALVPAHAFDRHPCLLRVSDGQTETLFDPATPAIGALIAAMGQAEAIAWKGHDGLDVYGYLAMPRGIENPPLVTFIHGGPSHLFRNGWSVENPIAALLVSQGYAVLFPNPRGSSGRGLDYAARVIGDWGGGDCQDIIAGIDHVVATRPVDGSRLLVIGGSYGGYMTSWLVTQSDRFRAACAMVPLTDMRSFSFTAHHPEFLAIYTGGTAYEVGGIFDTRSPLRHADKVVTPTLLIAGAMDNTTPSTQASQFYRALEQRNVPTELVIYPQEGHAVLRLEAQIDQGVRILEWFATYGAA